MSQPYFGYEGHLLLSVVDNTATSPTIELFDGTNHTSAEFLEIKGITDEENNFSGQKVDTTDREAARNGFTTEVNVASSGEISFTLFNRPGNPFVAIILDAWQNRTQLPLWSADGDPTAASSSRPVRGLLANFSVEARTSRPVQGVQTYQIRLSASSEPRFYEIATPLLPAAVA